MLSLINYILLSTNLFFAFIAFTQSPAFRAERVFTQTMTLGPKRDLGTNAIIARYIRPDTLYKEVQIEECRGGPISNAEISKTGLSYSGEQYEFSYDLYTVGDFTYYSFEYVGNIVKIQKTRRDIDVVTLTLGKNIVGLLGEIGPIIELKPSQSLSNTLEILHVILTMEVICPGIAPSIVWTIELKLTNELYREDTTYNCQELISEAILETISRVMGRRNIEKYAYIAKRVAWN